MARSILVYPTSPLNSHRFGKQPKSTYVRISGGFPLGLCPPKKTENCCQGTRNLCTKERVSGGCRRCLSPQLWHTELALSQWLVYNVGKVSVGLDIIKWVGTCKIPSRDDPIDGTCLDGLMDEKTPTFITAKPFGNKLLVQQMSTCFSMFISSFPGKLNSKHLKNSKLFKSRISFSSPAVQGFQPTSDMKL